jgi:hypothetical protein
MPFASALLLNSDYSSSRQNKTKKNKKKQNKTKQNKTKQNKTKTPPPPHLYEHLELPPDPGLHRRVLGLAGRRAVGGRRAPQHHLWQRGPALHLSGGMMWCGGCGVSQVCSAVLCDRERLKQKFDNVDSSGAVFVL